MPASSGSDRCTLDYNAAVHVLPKRDHEFSGECSDHRRAEPATTSVDALIEPPAERRISLVSQPQPCELKRGCSQPLEIIPYPHLSQTAPFVLVLLIFFQYCILFDMMIIYDYEFRFFALSI